MKIAFNPIAFLMLLPFFIACDKEDDGGGGNANLDKEIRIDFPLDYWSTKDTAYELFPLHTHLQDFSKNNYADIDSIFFICAIATRTGDTAYVRLNSKTDDEIIHLTEFSQSTVSGLELEYSWTTSKNIIDVLPNENSDICILMKSKRNEYVVLRSAYLLIKRK